MRREFSARYPDGQFQTTRDGPRWREIVQTANTVVLLFPDPIGFGFGAIEREVRRLASPLASIRFLNGRGRTLQLSLTTRAQLKLRRFLTRVLATEILLGGALLIATPFLVAHDLIRGRK